MVTSQAQQQMYTHAAEPKAVQQRRAKYREEEQSAGSPLNSNIMFDKRVARGNTYSARILPAEPNLTDKKSTSGRKKTVRQRPVQSPPAIEGRKHIDIQTDAYLEELTDNPPELDNATQTDAFLDRPPTPLFVPQKTGLDATTQIATGDLFDFDFEVEPILEVLVGKILEQGLMEVLEEEELTAMRAHQEHFEEIRNAELVATQRMEAAEKRKLEEKERRLAQERERVERERVVRQKVAATVFARGYLNGIVNTVFDELASVGYFYDPLEREVANDFMPWLKEQAVAYLEQGVVARQVVKRIVHAATEQLAARQAAGRQRSEAEASTSQAAAEDDSAARAEAESRAEEAIKNRATWILTSLRPAVVTPKQIEEMREELTASAEGASTLAWEEAKAAAAENARAEGEQKRDEQQARLAEAAEAAAEAAAAAEEEAEEGEEPAEPVPPPEAAPEEPLIDVEAIVAEAVAKVEKPKPVEVTDGDILSAMIEKNIVTKESIVQNMAINSLGDKGYINHPLFAEDA